MSATVSYLPGARPVSTDWATETHGVLDAVEALLATGRPSDVIAFCERAVSYLEANAFDIEDPTPLVRISRRLGDLQRRAAVHQRAVSRGRDRAVRAGGPASVRQVARPPRGP